MSSIVLHASLAQFFPPQFCDIEKLVNLVSPKLAKLVEFTLETQNFATFFCSSKKIINPWFFMKKMQFLNLRKTLQVLHISGCGVDLKMQEKTI
jgi:hypothetical protein